MESTLTNSNASRENLGFISAVRSNFQFLIDNFGFELIKEELTFVRYETKLLFVNIYHGRLSYELGFECGLQAKGENSRYRLSTILRGELGDAHNKQTSYQASNKKAVYSCLGKIADLVSEYCVPILQAENLAFARVEQAAGDEGRELTERYTIGPIKAQAEQAWIKKDYEKVRSLYISIKDNLSPVELKRLRYADIKVQ